MRVLDLFAGIGGFSLAAHWMGWTTTAFVERDKFCQRVLRKNFGQDIEIHDDITTFSGKPFRGRVDVVTGGFPCQPFSQAGKRKGMADDRYLWPEMLRTISEVQPRFVVGENVLGLVNWSRGLVFEQVQADLENAGYEVWAGVVPACAKNAPHRRDRLWIVAHSDSGFNSRAIGRSEDQEAAIPEQHRQADSTARQLSGASNGDGERGKCNRYADVSDTDRNGQNTRDRKYEIESGERRFDALDDVEQTILHTDNAEQPGQCSSSEREGEPNGPDSGSSGRAAWRSGVFESPICRGNDGVRQKLDERRLHALGNSIVPQVAFEIFKAIDMTYTAVRRERS